MEKLVLNYVGNDSWDRPVYEDNGEIFVDVDPFSYHYPKICTKSDNNFDGEPDTPISYMERYDGVEVEFLPQRVTWK